MHVLSVHTTQQTLCSIVMGQADQSQVCSCLYCVLLNFQTQLDCTQGRTALHIAAKQEEPETLFTLLSCGADAAAVECQVINWILQPDCIFHQNSSHPA